MYSIMVAASAQGQPAALRGGGSALSGYREGARAPGTGRGRVVPGPGWQLIFAGRWSSSGESFKGLPGTRTGTRGYPREVESARADARILARFAVHFIGANMAP